MAFKPPQESWCDDLQELYAGAKHLGNLFDEEFSTGQDLALDDAGVSADVAALGYTYAKIAAAVNQAMDNLVKFYEDSAVTTRQYGGDIRLFVGSE